MLKQTNQPPPPKAFSIKFTVLPARDLQAELAFKDKIICISLSLMHLLINAFLYVSLDSQ